jgi:carotenoid cleavage dioxygenase-like enzyme
MGARPRISRRDLLRQGAVGGLALGALSATGGAILAACGSASTATRRSTSTPTTAPPDSAGARWWLEGNFGPVHTETTATTLKVTGSLPKELTGLYVRNGSNPLQGISPHWFLGDGMIHGVRLDAGAATWYRNRWVRTGLYERGGGLGAAGAPGGTATLSNVSVVSFAGKTLSLGEVGVPYVLDPTDLSTIGPALADGGANGNMTAHPKIDPATGHMHSFGYGFTEPFLEYRVHDANGILVTSQAVALPRSVMMHDFAITGSDVIFMDLPVLFDLKGAVRMVSDPSSEALPYRWDPKAGARIGIMPLGGPTSAIRWVDIEPCFVYHTINATRQGGAVILDVCRLDNTFGPPTLASASTGGPSTPRGRHPRSTTRWWMCPRPTFRPSTPATVGPPGATPGWPSSPPDPARWPSPDASTSTWQQAAWTDGSPGRGGPVGSGCSFPVALVRARAG